MHDLKTLNQYPLILVCSGLISTEVKGVNCLRTISILTRNFLVVKKLIIKLSW